MNGLVAAPLQFYADRRFAGAGNAFNQIISPAHRLMIPFRVGCCTWAGGQWKVLDTLRDLDFLHTTAAWVDHPFPGRTDQFFGRVTPTVITVLL
jgi:hypothetical protein